MCWPHLRTHLTVKVWTVYWQNCLYSLWSARSDTWRGQRGCVQELCLLHCNLSTLTCGSYGAPVCPHLKTHDWWASVSRTLPLCPTSAPKKAHTDTKINPTFMALVARSSETETYPIRYEVHSLIHSQTTAPCWDGRSLNDWPASSGESTGNYCCWSGLWRWCRAARRGRARTGQ